MSDEQFDTIDDDGNIIGVATRDDCHGNPELIHRAVHVLVIDLKKRLYLQKRSMKKLVQPGKWDTSVGGHVVSGEGYEAAAEREMEEELAITGASLNHLFDYKIRNELESENVRTFLVFWGREIAFNTDEISDGRFWEKRGILDNIGRGLFTPSFEKEYDLFQQSNAFAELY
jgi:isopentenyldiphosphate isomerase